jgi:hypothetical protein
LIINSFHGIGLIILCFATETSREQPIKPDQKYEAEGSEVMEFEAIKAAVLKLDEQEQRRVVLELLPAIWPKIAADEACLKLIKKLIDAESVKRYQEEHLDHI